MPISQADESRQDVTRRREALEELIRSEGWQVFVAYARREWEGVGYKQRMGVALSGPDPEAAKVTHRASLEIMRLLQWPKDQVDTLKGDSE